MRSVSLSLFATRPRPLELVYHCILTHSRAVFDDVRFQVIATSRCRAAFGAKTQLDIIAKAMLSLSGPQCTSQSLQTDGDWTTLAINQTHADASRAGATAGQLRGHRHSDLLGAGRSMSRGPE